MTVTQKIYDYYWACGVSINRTPHIINRLGTNYIKSILSNKQIMMYINGDVLTSITIPLSLKETVIGGDEKTPDDTAPVVVYFV